MNCNTHNCPNQKWQGAFVGNLCKPCHEFYTKVVETRVNNSGTQAYINHLDDSKMMLKRCEIYIIEQKYK